MEKAEKYGHKFYVPKYGIGQVVRLKEFPEIKLQITEVDASNGYYICISKKGDDTYQKDKFVENLIEPHPDHELLPPYTNFWIEAKDYGSL